MSTHERITGTVTYLDPQGKWVAVTISPFRAPSGTDNGVLLRQAIANGAVPFPECQWPIADAHLVVRTAR